MIQLLYAAESLKTTLEMVGFGRQMDGAVFFNLRPGRGEEYVEKYPSSGAPASYGKFS